MLGTWALHGWVAGAAPDRFCCVYLQLKSCWGCERRGVQSGQTLSPWALQPTCPRDGLRGRGTAGAAPLHPPELNPLPWFLSAIPRQEQHLLHFIQFKAQWSDVTFLPPFLEKYSLRINFPLFPPGSRIHQAGREIFPKCQWWMWIQQSGSVSKAMD